MPASRSRTPAEEHLPTAAAMAGLASARAGFGLWLVGFWLWSEAVDGELIAMTGWRY